VDTSAAAVSREIPVQEGLSIQEVRGMADFVRIRYLEAGRGRAGHPYQERWSGAGDRVEVSWKVSLPLDRTQAGPSALETYALLSIGPSSVFISFPDLDVGDSEGIKTCNRVADDIEILVTSFLTNAKMASLYFIFPSGPGQAVRDVPASSSGIGKEVMKRIFSGNMVNLYLLIMAVSFVLFYVLGDMAIFPVMGIQLLALFFSDRLALEVGKVRPTADRPKVTVVSVSVPPGTQRWITKFGKSIMPDINERLEKALAPDAHDGSQATAAVEEALASSGFRTSPGDVKIITRDVYGLVRGVAARFRLPVPRIVIMNKVAANAAATGVSPGRAAISITAGSLEDLDDREFSSIVGHEMGHIKGRDSLILFSVTFLLYVGGLYLWLPLLLYLGLLYYIVVFAIIYGVGKVLETRADTQSVVNLGQPAVLSDALADIGFRELYYERYSPGVRLLNWLRFDPHPPIYFRVERLSRLASTGAQIKHATLVSMRDCTLGFLRALVGG